MSERSIRILQALDSDPLFEGARYTFSVEGQGDGFEVAVAISRYYVHLLTLSERRGLEEIAEDVASRALAAGVRGPATLRVSADGRVMHGNREIASLQPLTKKAVAAATAAHG